MNLVHTEGGVQVNGHPKSPGGNRGIDLRDRFLSIAAHELRTPLTTLRGNIQMLMRARDRGETIDGERLDASIDSMKRATDRLNKLINDLLNISRIRLGRIEIETQLADLAEIVHQSVISASAQIARPSHRRIILIRPPHPCPARLDPDRFGQVIDELIENAIKYSPEDSQIDVIIEEASDRWSIRVVDRGIGVDPLDIGMVFTAFGRSMEAVATQKEGVGLGMYVARQVINLHGGTIALFSEGQDRGTTVVVSIPRPAIV